MPAAMTTVTAELRSSTERGYALYVGEKHDIVDERTGEVIERDHYHWVAKKLCTIERHWIGRAGEKMVEIAMPEWLATKEGLV